MGRIARPKSRVIGGYYELELCPGQEYHSEAMRFNSGRNALCYYLKQKSIKRLHLPMFLPDSLLDALTKAGIETSFYHLDPNFRPVIEHFTDAEEDAYLAVNYFGVSDTLVQEAIALFPNIVVDNCQAFFTHPEKNCATFFSARKFFGVADGAYLYADIDADSLETDRSAQRYMAQLVRLDGDVKDGAFLHRNSERLLAQQPVRKMSKLTQRVLRDIRYDLVWEKRDRNFRHLHSELGSYNQLKIDTHASHGAIAYPFLFSNKDIKRFLQSRGILTQSFWPEVVRRTPADSIESFMAGHITGLPIDQRYGETEMDYLSQTVKEFIEKYGAGKQAKQREINLVNQGVEK